MSTVHSSHVVKTPVIVSSGWACDASRRSDRAFTRCGRWQALADVQTISAHCAGLIGSPAQPPAKKFALCSAPLRLTARQARWMRLFLRAALNQSAPHARRYRAARAPALRIARGLRALRLGLPVDAPAPRDDAPPWRETPAVAARCRSAIRRHRADRGFPTA